MALVLDWTVEIRNLVLGSDPYTFSGPIGGLGLPAPRTGDQPRGDLTGDVAGADVLARRILTLPLNVDGSDPADTWDKLQALKAAWRPSTVDVALDLRLPGLPTTDGTLRFYGRPRGLADELALLRAGHVDVLATFDALDPLGYGPPETVILEPGTTIVTNPGDATSDRWTIELARTGDPSAITNGADDEPGLSLDPGGAALALDGRARTITRAGTGDDAYGLLRPGSGWPVLVPGSNPVTVTGGTATLTFRPAYL